MATKKSTKSTKKTPVDPPKKEESAPFRVVDDPIMPVENYLMSVGTRPYRIKPMSVWAAGKGLSVATVSQWKTLFKSY